MQGMRAPLPCVAHLAPSSWIEALPLKGTAGPVLSFEEHDTRLRGQMVLRFYILVEVLGFVEEAQRGWRGDAACMGSQFPCAVSTVDPDLGPCGF